MSWLSNVSRSAHRISRASRVEPIWRAGAFQALEARAMMAVDPYCGVDHSLEGFGAAHGHGAEYQLGPRWNATATNGTTGTAGNPITLTWGVIADGTPIPGGNGEPASPSILRARLNGIYGSQATWLPIVQSVFDRWGQISGVTYVYESSDDGVPLQGSPGQLGVRADLRIGGHHFDGASNVLAYNFFPNNGDMTLDTDDFVGGGFYTDTSQSSRGLRNTMSHEHGHGMGLFHVEPVSSTKLMEPFISTFYDGPQFDDILAAQSHYGDPREKNGRNETALNASDLGTLANGANQALVQQVSLAANGSDADYYKFTINSSRTLSFTVSPSGTTYTQGPQGGPFASFNAAAQADLALTVYTVDGTTVLGSSNATGLGGSETVGGISLGPGTYFVRVSMNGSGATQMYQLNGTVSTFVGPDAPTAPDLADADDTGPSNTDNVTTVTTPTFSGTATPGATVRLFRGATLVGTVTADAGTGAWSIQNATPLADGSYVFTATAQTGAGTSAPSAAAVTVDTSAPATSNFAFNFALGHNATLSFSENLASTMVPSRFTLTNLTTSTVVPPASIAVFYDVPTNAATLTFVGFPRGILPDGNYRLALSSVTDLAGNPASPNTYDFFVLAGDINRDRTVGLSDFSQLTANYNQTPRTFLQGDFDYDNTVGLTDFAIMTQRFNIPLPPPASAPGAAPQPSAQFAATVATPRAALFSDRRIDRELEAVELTA